MSVDADPGVAAFEAHRRALIGLAYRMLGSIAEAEDVVQDAWLRWYQAERETVRDPGAFLHRIVTRLCLDRLKSARAQRETYIGPWLPEPVLDTEALGSVHGAEEWAGDLSFALMLALERLSALERAAFLLHDIFDLDFAEVAAALGRSEAACRQLAARARAHLREARPRFTAPPEAGERLAGAFLKAARSGEVTTLAQLLAEDAVLYTDGGGRKRAALNPIRGRERIARFFAGLARKGAIAQVTAVHPALINGLPGYLVVEADGTLQTVAIEAAAGAITAIYIVSNPDKLGHLTPLAQAGRFA
jgi:RNA polymerase sigma-70 factor (ECF subfamily)